MFLVVCYKIIKSYEHLLIKLIFKKKIEHFAKD